MIEIIYKEEQKKTQGKEEIFRIPNNIRQIGEVKGHQKIYIEDYAYTFLKKISRNQEKGGKAAILFGEYHWLENIFCFLHKPVPTLFPKIQYAPEKPPDFVFQGRFL